MNSIENIRQLRAEKKRLTIRKLQLEESLSSEIDELNENLKPVQLALNLIFSYKRGRPSFLFKTINFFISKVLLNQSSRTIKDSFFSSLQDFSASLLVNSLQGVVGLIKKLFGDKIKQDIIEE